MHVAEGVQCSTGLMTHMRRYCVHTLYRGWSAVHSAYAAVRVVLALRVGTVTASCVPLSLSRRACFPLSIELSPVRSN